MSLLKVMRKRRYLIDCTASVQETGLVDWRADDSTYEVYGELCETNFHGYYLALYDKKVSITKSRSTLYT